MISFVFGVVTLSLLNVKVASLSAVSLLSFSVYLNTGISKVLVVVVAVSVLLLSPYVNFVSFLFPVFPISALSFNVAEYVTIS